MSESVFEIRNLRKSYGKHVVLDDINIKVKAGEILGLIGSSGSGKTTLLNSIIGFIKPDSGEIMFRHKTHDKKKSDYLSVERHQQLVKTKYGFASQSPSFYDKLTVIENLRYFGSLHGLSRLTIETNAQTLLKLMGLEAAESTLAKNLSGGMERRLDISCAMMHDPDVLLLDEPTADLDPILRKHIWDLVKMINKKGTSIILASHHLAELEDLCSRIAIIKKGNIRAVGSPKEILEQFSENQEIRLTSSPGKYGELLKLMNKKHITNSKVSNKVLIMQTNKQQEALESITSALRKRNEKLLSISINKATLDEIFMNVMKDEK
ncbi:MAG: ABC transporter ATP-binding protein [Candidatus Woesearchaeota archaeon]|nr:MAG: ABC transporter ATP-binding protein [Candidatus Woesearchaeota archaeon]